MQITIIFEVPELFCSFTTIIIVCRFASCQILNEYASMDRIILILMTGVLWPSGVPQNTYALDSYHSDITALVMYGRCNDDRKFE